MNDDALKIIQQATRQFEQFAADRDKLAADLQAIADWGRDPESDHSEADRLLLAFIGDHRVTEAFDAIPKWYA